MQGKNGRRFLGLLTTAALVLAGAMLVFAGCNGEEKEPKGPKTVEKPVAKKPPAPAEPPIKPIGKKPALAKKPSAPPKKPPAPPKKPPAPAKEPPAAPKKPPAASKGAATKTPEVTRAEEVQGFMYEDRSPVGMLRPTRKPLTGKKLVEVEARLFFPKAKEWDLTTIQLETQDAKRWQPLAINYGSLFFMTSEGAFVSVWDDGGINPVFGLPLTPRKVKFLREWKGGKVKVRLAFEIPQDASAKRLHHGDATVAVPMAKRK